MTNSDKIKYEELKFQQVCSLSLGDLEMKQPCQNHK
jgi:hypothetical protein